MSEKPVKIARVKRKSKAELYSLSDPHHERHDLAQQELAEEEYLASRKDKKPRKND